MPIQGLKSTLTKIQKFHDDDHLNQLMMKVDASNRKNVFGKFKARGMNFQVLGTDLGGLFFNLVKAPFLTAIQPGTTLVLAGTALTDKIIRPSFKKNYEKFSFSLTRVDYQTRAEKNGTGMAFRRKVLHVLSKIRQHTPSIVDLCHTIVNIAKYAIAFFSSLTLGFIFVDANIWVHHKLDLVCDPDLAKKDRKHQILNHVKELEGDSLKKSFKERFRKKIDMRAKKILRAELLGNGQFIANEQLFENDQEKLKKNLNAIKGLYTEELNEKADVEERQEVLDKIHDKQQKYLKMRRFIVDDNNMLKAAIEKAVETKREAAKAELEKQEGRELSPEDMKFIQDMYWKKLSEPFAFEINEDLPNDYKEFLSTHFNWDTKMRQHKVLFPFKSKESYDEYMVEYNKWNLTLPEGLALKPQKESGVLLETLPKKEITNTEEQKNAAYINSENKFLSLRRKRNRKIVRMETECADFEQEVTRALKAKRAELDKELSKEINSISKKIKTQISIEKEILKSSLDDGQNISAEEVDEIIKSKGKDQEFTDEEKKDFQDFALTATETARDMKGKEEEWEQRMIDARSAKEEEFMHKFAEEEMAVNIKVKTLTAIKKEILKETNDQNLTPEKVNEILETIPYEFSEDEQKALCEFASNAVETIKQNEKNIHMAAKKRSAFMPIEHYYKLKNIVMRQLRGEFPTMKSTDGVKFNRPKDLKAKINVDQEILQQVDAKIEKMVDEEMALRMKAFNNKNNLGKDILDEPQAPAAETREEMRKKYEDVEKPRLYEQLLLEKMFLAVNDKRKSSWKPKLHEVEEIKKRGLISFDGKEREVRFEALEKRRRNAFETFLSMHYQKAKKEDEKAVRVDELDVTVNSAGEKIPLQAYRLEINKKEGLVYKEWADVKLTFAEDDFEGETKVWFKNKKDNKPINDKQDESIYKDLIYDELDQVEIRKKPWILNEAKLPVLTKKGILKATTTRKKVFEEVAKKYKDIKYQIREELFHFKKVKKQPIGFNVKFEEHQKNVNKELWEKNKLWVAFNKERKENDKLKQENVKLKQKLEKLGDKDFEFELPEDKYEYDYENGSFAQFLEMLQMVQRLPGDKNDPADQEEENIPKDDAFSGSKPEAANGPKEEQPVVEQKPEVPAPQENEKNDAQKEPPKEVENAANPDQPIAEDPK